MTYLYKREPFTDFTLPQNKKEFQNTLEKIEKELGVHHDILIDGERITTIDKITSFNPANKYEIVGTVGKADTDIAETAIVSARKSFQVWRDWQVKDRAGILFRTAAIIRYRKHEFSAYLVKESGKSWQEADADVARGIDFMEYYGRQMIDLEEREEINRSLIKYNQYLYQPLGIAVTISSSYFPFSTMVQTTVAPLVTGNTVILKPSSSTPIIAAKFVEVLEEVGIPSGVISFLPGSGEEVGDYLVNHPKTNLIIFTGSRDVGIRIWEQAAKVHPTQAHLKRAIVEWGGRDTIIVDNDVDIDLAAEELIASAFGFSARKRFTGSRAIIHQDIYKSLLERVIDLTNKLNVGDPFFPDNYMGPVTNQRAYLHIMSYLEVGKKEGRLVAGGIGDDSQGYFVRPTIFADVQPESRIMQEELFGPVIVFCKANDFEQALSIANNTKYGVTGALITNNHDHMERARYDFHVENLYVNHNCTETVEGYHPFNRFQTLEVDSKIVKRDYLQLHMRGKNVLEGL